MPRFSRTGSTPFTHFSLEPTLPPPFPPTRKGSHHNQEEGKGQCGESPGTCGVVLLAGVFVPDGGGLFAQLQPLCVVLQLRLDLHHNADGLRDIIVIAFLHSSSTFV